MLYTSTRKIQLRFVCFIGLYMLAKSDKGTVLGFSGHNKSLYQVCSTVVFVRGIAL
ncbi:hypothetical protein V6Z12_A06G111900 [Gossypium hirsutum]